jgi:hypothetical protein
VTIQARPDPLALAVLQGTFDGDHVLVDRARRACVTKGKSPVVD